MGTLPFGADRRRRAARQRARCGATTPTNVAVAHDRHPAIARAALSSIDASVPV